MGPSQSQPQATNQHQARKKRAGLHGYRVTYQNAANGQEKIKSYEHKVPKKGKHAICPMAGNGKDKVAVDPPEKPKN